MHFQLIVILSFLELSTAGCRSTSNNSGLSSDTGDEVHSRIETNLAGRRFENSEKNWDLEFVSNGLINRKSQNRSVISYRSSNFGNNLRIEAELWSGSSFILEFSPNRYQAIVFSAADQRNHRSTYRKYADSLKMASVVSITSAFLNGNRYESADGKLVFEFRDDKLKDLSNDGSFGLDRSYNYKVADNSLVWERGTVGDGRPMKHKFQFSNDLNYIDYTNEFDHRSIIKLTCKNCF
ncbi:MAG: hypothetical protein NTV34_10275 [Proteobacteria bacterium]|nr:hypothetical protein [Pseudomonadota bacterium]